MNFIFQGSQKMHVRVAISQKGLVNFFRYAHQIEAFFIPVHTPVSLFMGRFFPLEFHSAKTNLEHASEWDRGWGFNSNKLVRAGNF